MLDIRQIRQNSAAFKKELIKRKQKEKIPLLTDLIKKDKHYRKLLKRSQELRNKKNQITKEIDLLKKQKKQFKAKILQAKKIPPELKKVEQTQKKLKEKIDYSLRHLPNLLHESVPIGKDENDNRVVRFGGSPIKRGFKLIHHGELARKLNQADFERATRISGAGFFFLKNDLAELDLALQQLAIRMLQKKGFTLTLPPLLLKKKPYESVTDLETFNDVLYKVEGEDLYLIATSEHSLAAMYQGEIFNETDLPIRLCGVSPCFRKEVGKHSIDERGFFRVHQFNKVEQFIFCTPSQSLEILEELLKNAEEILKALKLHYAVTNVSTGDIGSVASKKYDINAWSPREKKYIEVMSISNCTSYQSIGLGIKFRKKGGEKEFVHTLNGTMVATSRLMRILIEVYQTKKDTIQIPKILQPLMNGKKEITKSSQF